MNEQEFRMLARSIATAARSHEGRALTQATLYAIRAEINAVLRIKAYEIPSAVVLRSIKASVKADGDTVAISFEPDHDGSSSAQRAFDAAMKLADIELRDGVLTFVGDEVSQ